MEDKIQRLSEGMDFIEEACGYNEPLQYTEINESVISESEGIKSSPYKVLGRCSGVFQPIGEYSRNKRIYSRDLWPKILENEDLKSRLAHRAVFGCLGHADKLVDDKDIQEGKVSHIVTVLEVRKDERNNPYLYGELEILDTPAGRILEAMYKGGADLYVSSRAAGKLVPIPGDPENRMMVNPSNYFFHCFDVVARPGFVKARPTFESISTNESLQQETPKEAIVESKEEINEADSSIEELRAKIDQLAKIVEKVVDDVYEDPEAPVEEAKEEMKEEKKTNKKVAIPAFLTIMAESNISAEALSEIIDMIKGDISNG